MYVCLCNGIREAELKRLGLKGVRDVHEAFAALDIEPVCTSCLDEVETVLHGEGVLQKLPDQKQTDPSHLKLVG